MFEIKLGFVLQSRLIIFFKKYKNNIKSIENILSVLSLTAIPNSMLLGLALSPDLTLNLVATMLLGLASGRTQHY